MNFTPNITEYNLNAINDYNQFLQGHASFDVKNNEFEEALEKEVQRAKRQQQPFSIIGIDLDFLKKINDFCCSHCLFLQASQASLF